MRLVPFGEKNLRRIIQNIHDLATGRSNATGVFTCDANQATTAITDERVQVGDYIFCAPFGNANSRTEFGGGSFGIAAVTTPGTFTVHHTNDANADKKFVYHIMQPPESEL